MKKQDSNVFKFYTSLSDVYIVYDKEIVSQHSGMTDSKYLLVMGYLRKNMSSLGIIQLTINDLVVNCGYSISGGTRTNQNQFKEILKNMIKDGSICILDQIDINNININTMFKIKLSAEKCMFQSNNFVLIGLDEFETIINSDSSNNKSVLLLVYLNIKKNIYTSGFSSSESTSITLKLLSKNCDLSITTIKKAIEKLDELKLICTETVSIKSNDRLIKRNLFALNHDELIKGEKYFMDYYGVTKIYKSKETEKQK